MIDDVGSGVLADTAGYSGAVRRAALRQSVAAGAALVCCSGDKLLGGPQAGLLVGHADAVAAARKHPLARALRIDKLSLAALEATLRLYRDPRRAREEIPGLRMLDSDEQTLADRAHRSRRQSATRPRIMRATAKVAAAHCRCRARGPVGRADGRPPTGGDHAQRCATATRRVIARIHDGQVLLDPRTLADTQIEAVAAAARRAVRATAAGSAPVP